MPVHFPLCIEVDCNTQASCNFPGEKKRLYCACHKKPEMINLKHIWCIHPGCSVDDAAYGYKGGKRRYCNEHKLSTMVNLKMMVCKMELCTTHAMKKYDGYCMYCYIHLFPDRPVARNYKTKEKFVVDYVTEHFEEHEFAWVADKTIGGGCSNRRPDLILDLGYQVLIIEIDENQHRDYNCSCENRRTMELSQDVNHRPIIFVRFNPDKYIDNNNNVINSCWHVNASGIMIVNKKKQKEWIHRLNMLCEEVTYWIQPENQTIKTVEQVELFYDGHVSHRFH
jgi:hypothetical protein